MTRRYGQKHCDVPGCDRPHKSGGLCNVHGERKRRGGDPFAPDHTRHGLPDAFIEQSLLLTTDECITWPFSISAYGYAQGSFGPNQKSVSRHVCERVHGKPPTPEHQAAHSCGRGKMGCINWKHLYWATREQNAADKVGHGTAPIGERHPNHKLTEAAVREIRRVNPRNKQDCAGLATQFGVTPGTVLDAARGKTWGTVDSFMLLDCHDNNLGACARLRMSAKLPGFAGTFDAHRLY